MGVTWTIAYRKRTGNVFHRVTNWAGTWAEARDMASAFGELNPDLQVWYTTTAAWEASEAVNLPARVAAGEITQDLADSYLEDHGNILVDSGKRIKIRDNGTLPAVLLNDAHSSAAWEAATEGLPRVPAFTAPSN